MKQLNLPPINNTHRGKSMKNSMSTKKYNYNMKRVTSDSNLNKANNDATKSFVEDMKKGSYNILVCVRCRPLSISEKQLSSYETIRIMDNKMVILMDPIEYNGPSTVFKNRNREQTYAFDFAFDKTASQNLVFENSTQFLIDGVVNGYNATVFAYGATGAGKTYTMLGNESNPGIMPLTLRELFNKVNSMNDRDYKLKFWYLEIYNENIRDLLKFVGKNNNNNVENTSNEYLDLREDPERGIVVSGINEINVTNSYDMLKILKRGNRNRTQEATGANETSSRSHAILQVSIEYKDKNTGIDIEIKYSKLSLIDLAGSERASATQNRGIRLIEGANINRSLLTLGNCINALCDASMKGNKKPYIPYRDSKLTRLLKDSLGGNARTVMIANVSPSINTFDDTYNTLKYANRAKNIKTFVTRNVLNAQYHISNYVNIINNLKEEVSQLRQQLQMRDGGNNNNYNISNNNTIQNYHRSYYDNENKTQIEDSFINNNNTINTYNVMSDGEFNNIVKEMKKACENQITVKQKMISIQNEINKLNDNTSNKYNNLQKTLELNQKRYKELGEQIEKIYNTNSAKNECTEIQKDYLTLLIKNSSYKIQILENKYYNMLNLSNNNNNIKDEYIKELEKQIRYRDEIISDNQIEIIDDNQIKNLDKLKQEYSSKNNINLTGGFKRTLPPISGHTSFNNELTKNISNISNISNINNKSNFNVNNNFRNKGIIVNNSNNNHLESMRSKFSTKQNNNNNNKLGNFKIKDNNSQYRIMRTKNNSRINSPKGKDDKKYNYDKYKYDPSLNKNRIYSSKKNNKKDLFNFRALYKRSNSFSLDNSSNGNNSFDSGGPWDGTVIKDQMPQIKRSDLNSALNERNNNRKKFLDKINNANNNNIL